MMNLDPEYAIHLWAMDIKKQINEKLESYTHKDFGKFIAINHLIEILNSGDTEKIERLVNQLKEECNIKNTQ